jgi:hypothetical protein
VLPVRAAQTRQAADGTSGLIAGELNRSPDDETLRPRSSRGRMAAIGTVALTHDPATVLAEAVDAHRCRAAAQERLCGLGEIAIDARQDRLQTGLRVAHLGLPT